MRDKKSLLCKGNLFCPLGAVPGLCCSSNDIYTLPGKDLLERLEISSKMEVVQSVINQCPSLSTSYFSSADHSGQRLGCRTGMPLYSEHARKAVKHIVELVMTTSATSVDDS